MATATKTKAAKGNPALRPVRMEQVSPLIGKPARPTIENTQLLCFFLAAISLVIYARCLSNDFVDYDDHQYITQNAHVQSGLNRAMLRWAFTTFEAGNWHPLTWISHAFDVQVFRMAPTGHHLDSMLLHTFNVVLLFLLLWKATGARGRSLTIATLFAVHPLNVECVAWIAERKSLLCTFFFFLALGCYGWYVKRPSVWRYGILILLFAFGLMAKPMVITLPFVLLLLDYWPLQRIGRVQFRNKSTMSRNAALRLLLEKAPLFALSITSGIITVLAQSQANAIVTLASVPFSIRLENAICSYVLYLWKAVWPFGLGLFYPETAPRLSLVFVALAILFIISIWAWREREERPYLLIGWLWYLGTLVPVIGLVQVGAQAMADRYAYIPLIGFFLMIVWRIAEWCDSRVYSRWWRVAAVTIVLSGLAIVTHRQTGYWHNPYTLWSRSLQVTTDNYVAEDNLGLALIAMGRNNEAIPHFNNALRLNTTDPTADMGLEIVYRESDPRQAIQHGEAALALTTSPQQLVAIYNGIGLAYAQLHEYEPAGDNFRQALRIDSSDETAMMALGNTLLRQAAQRMSQKLDQHPTAEGFSQLGSVWEQAGDYGSAKSAYKSAVDLDPRLASAQEGLQRLARAGP